MNEVIKRGEIYWLHSGNPASSVEQMRRPIVIVSSDKGNESNNPTIMGVPLTTQTRYGVINPEINSGVKRSWAMCNQVMVYDKVSIGNYIGTLSEYEMAAVDKGLRIALSLFEPQSEDDEEEKRELEEEIEQLRTRLKTRDDDKLGVIVERDMWKKMYEKALDELVSLRVNRDVAESKPVPVYEAKVDEPKKVAKPEPEEKRAEEKRVEEKRVEEKLVEINTCTEDDLRKVGCTLTMIHNIVANRPYKAVTDLKVVPGVTRIAYQILESKVCCVPVVKPKPVKVEPAKVNINTATATEIMNCLGIGKFYAYVITAYRNKNGNYGSVEELLSVPKIPKDFLERYGGLLTV